MTDILVFDGSGSTQLAARIRARLHARRPASEVLQFSEGTTFVRVLETVRGRRAYVVQSTAFPANDRLVELLFWMDALRRASAESVTAVIPYFSYGKGDKKDEPRVSIRARVCADALEAAGANRVVTMDLHAPQIQGFFRVPIDDLYAYPVLCDALSRLRCCGPDCTVVSPDAGFVKKARLFAAQLGCPLAIADKLRRGHDEKAEVLRLLGDVRGRTAILVDDVILSGNTLVQAARLLVQHGAREVVAAVTHAALTERSVATLEESPIRAIVVTDTVEGPVPKLPPKFHVVSVAPLFAEAIRRIDRGESVSELFEPPGEAVRKPGKRPSR